MHGALPLRKVPRMGGGWIHANVRVDVTHLHGSVHLEAVHVWLKRFPIACPEGGYGKPTVVGS